MKRSVARIFSNSKKPASSSAAETWTSEAEREVWEVIEALAGMRVLQSTNHLSDRELTRAAK